MNNRSSEIQLNFFATCPKGLEGLLEHELAQLQAREIKQTVAGVYFSGDLSIAYRVCLWSRLANRVLLILSVRPVSNAAELYSAVRKINWLNHLAPDGTLLVDFAGRTETLTHTQFGAQKVKDAIVDQLREKTGKRPSIEKNQPSLRVNVYVNQNKATIAIDLAGESLHKRGYRLKAGVAPIKENLAAAILLRSQWLALAEQNKPLLDPLCGSGTFLIEAALMAADIAPGLLRTHFGFKTWRGHNEKIWQPLYAEAQTRRQQGLQRLKSSIQGYDADAEVVEIARDNIKRVGLESYIQVRTEKLETLKNEFSNQYGLLVANPPYGERLSDLANLEHIYTTLGMKLKQQFLNWQAAIFTGNPELGKKMEMRPHKQYNFFNGSIPCKLLLFQIEELWLIQHS